MFELCRKENQVVVRYAKDRLVVHGARNLDTFCEVEPDAVASELGWELVRTMPIHSIEEAKVAAQQLSGVACEGFVVRDAAFRRIKGIFLCVCIHPLPMPFAHAHTGCPRTLQ